MPKEPRESEAMTRKNASGLHKAAAPTDDPLSMLLEPPQETPAGAESEFVEEEQVEYLPDEPAPDPAARESAGNHARPRTSAARGLTQPPTAGAFQPLGWLLVVVGLAICGLAASGAVPVVSAFVEKGVLAGTALVAAGVVLVAARAVMAHQAATGSWLVAQQHAVLETVHSDLAELVAYQRAIAERPPKDDTEALDRATLAIQRQDEKLANLSKALKMYGKPLMEISQQTSEIGQLVTDLGQAVQAAKGSGEATTRTVETIVRGQLDGFEARQAPAQQKLEDVATATRAQQQAMITLQKDSREGIQRHVALEKQLDELKKQVASATEQLTKVSTSAAQPRDDGALLTRIEQQLAGTRDTVVAQLKKELATVQTQLARVQAIAATPTAAVSAAKPVKEPEPAKEAEAAPVAPPAAAAPGASQDPLGPGGLAQSIAGEKKTESRNVLGAIAKLKNMRK